MRARKHEEHENHERWLVSYADFITLLFAFFVVLYATSTQNTEKEKKFEESIREKLKLAGQPGQGGAAAGGIASNVIEQIDVFQRRNVGNEEMQDYVEQLVEKSLTDEERKSTISDIHHDKMGVKISLAASTFFPTGSSKLRLPALRSLDKLAAILKASNRSIVIEGHTDDQPVVGGQFETNWELASARATSVVRYLNKVHKIDVKRLAAMSYGETRPVAPNTSEQNRAKNRRIEVLIVNNNEVEF